MHKKIMAGILALTLMASSGTLAAGAIKLGDVNDDGTIDIEDAVAIINRVNGISTLTELEEKAADIDASFTIDIEDAVRIINHVNGMETIDDVEIKLDDPEPDPEPEIAVITLTNTGDSFKVQVGEAIPAIYGKGSDPDDLSTYDPQSWFLKKFENVVINGNVYERTIQDITCGGVSLQDMIDKGIPVEGDMEFTVLFYTKLVTPSGQRTLKIFDQILDDNYAIHLKADAYAMGMLEVHMDTDVRQKDSNNSNLKANLLIFDETVVSDIYSVDGKLYYVRNAELKQYSEGPSALEAALNVNQIFKKLATNRDNLKFVKERKDEETGYTVETFETVLELPLGAYNVTFDAYFDSADEFKKLTVMDESFNPSNIEMSELYLDTTELKFEPVFDGDIDVPDFSSWEITKAPMLW